MAIINYSKHVPFFTLFACAIVCTMPETAHAAASSGALFDSGTNFLNALETLLTGTWARIFAIIAVVITGFGWMRGHVAWGQAMSVIVGIILVFGAAAIVDSINAVI